MTPIYISISLSFLVYTVTLPVNVTHCLECWTSDLLITFGISRVKSGWWNTLSLSEESSVQIIFWAVCRYRSEKLIKGKSCASYLSKLLFKSSKIQVSLLGSLNRIFPKEGNAGSWNTWSLRWNSMLDGWNIGNKA